MIFTTDVNFGTRSAKVLTEPGCTETTMIGTPSTRGQLLVNPDLVTYRDSKLVGHEAYLEGDESDGSRLGLNIFVVLPNNCCTQLL